MLAGCESHLSPFCAAIEVLGHLRDRFIKEVTSKDIVHNLKHKNMITDDVLADVNREPGATRQSEILYEHLERTSTKDSLITVCEVIIAVPGNPRMQKFGQDMKNKLEGKLCVCTLHPHAWCDLHDPTPGANVTTEITYHMDLPAMQLECAICRPL